MERIYSNDALIKEAEKIFNNLNYVINGFGEKNNTPHQEELVIEAKKLCSSLKTILKGLEENDTLFEKEVNQRCNNVVKEVVKTLKHLGLLTSDFFGLTVSTQRELEQIARKIFD